MSQTSLRITVQELIADSSMLIATEQGDFVPADTKPNRLIHETSPYLLQHAHNPVDWYPWGEEAFQRAREEDKPIFLSVGYSACHWCHVMEHESFEDEEVARILNENFVSIKVDREERPDVDSIYMIAIQMMTQQGGWPMSVFLTPALQPFHGGTYFPPRSLYGRPGFRDLLLQLSQLWATQRERVNEVAGNVARALQADEVPEGSESAQGKTPPGREVLDAAYLHGERSFDSLHGGFGNAPKFPRPLDLSLLLHYWRNTGRSRALEMASLTLRKMARGGLHDQLGGGFHRYSTDDRWLVPHFEKMLYDNALLARTYLEAYQATGDAEFQDTARQTLEYVLREMTSPEGLFYSSTDADSDGREGDFFLWTPDEVEELLGTERARPFCHYYGITVGGNFEGKSILHREQGMEETARAFRVEPEKLVSLLREARSLLYDVRLKRSSPLRDEKVITSWNGLMIGSLARGFQVLRDRRYLDAAVRAGGMIEEKLHRDGQLFRIYKDGRARFPAYLDDHAYLAEGMLDLYEATFDPAYIERARSLMEKLLAEFWDAGEGGFFFTAVHHSDLIARRKDPFDNATPSANGVSALNLLRLHHLTGEPSYRERAAELLAGLKQAIESVPMGFSSTLMALDLLQSPPVEFVLVGDLESPGAQEMLQAIGRRLVNRRVLAGAPAAPDPDLIGKIPLLRGKEAVGGRPTVYLCRDLTCEAPLSDLAGLEARLDAIFPTHSTGSAP